MVREGPAGPPPPVDALTVLGATKSFNGVCVLHDVDLAVPAGAVRSIVGHNGSGKSTLVKLLSGFYPLEPGTRIAVDGVAVGLTSHAAAHAAGLRFVHQDLGLVGSLSTIDNLALGAAYPRRRVGTIAWKRARERSERLLADLGYDLDVTQPVSRLTSGGRTGVALARALQDAGGNARVIVLDEPTASMSNAEFRELARVIVDLTARGLSVVYITHHLEEVIDLGGDVTVLRNGRVVATAPVAGLSGDRLVNLMIGRDLTPAVAPGSADQPSGTGAVDAEVTGLGTRRIGRLDLQVRTGEVVGVTGLDGSGREEVAPALAGMLPRRGTVRVGGRLVRPGDPQASVRAGMGCTLADRQHSGVLPTMSAGWNLTISGVSRYRRRGLLSRRTEQRDAGSWMRRMGVTPPREEVPVRILSGGNQQKVLLGRWLRNSPRLLVLDEPTQGVDVAAQQDIHRQIREAAATCAVLICSSDANELAAMCQRVLVLRGGRVVADLAGAALTVEAMEAASLWEETAS